MIPALPIVICLAVTLVALVIAVMKQYDINPIRWITNKWLSLPPVGKVIIPVFVGVMVLHGSTKHRWTFTFENGVVDNGSTCSNDVITAKWTFNQAYSSYTFRWAYRDLTITNEVGICIDPYHQLPDARVSDGMAVANVLNATNMEVVCYAKYVQPVHVVTNGVYHVSGVMRSFSTTNSATPVFVTPGIQLRVIFTNGFEKILTPKNSPPQTALSVMQLEPEN